LSPPREAPPPLLALDARESREPNERRERAAKIGHKITAANDRDLTGANADGVFSAAATAASSEASCWSPLAAFMQRIRSDVSKASEASATSAHQVDAPFDLSVAVAEAEAEEALAFARAATSERKAEVGREGGEEEVGSCSACGGVEGRERREEVREKRKKRRTWEKERRTRLPPFPLSLLQLTKGAPKPIQAF